MMKVFFLTLLWGVALSLPFAGTPKAEVAGQGYCTAYVGSGQTGLSQTYYDYQHQLSSFYDNNICSATISGFWMFYQAAEFNKNTQGYYYYAYGMDKSFNFPLCDEVTSLKYANNRYAFNENAYTIYEGTGFSGDEFYGNIASDSLDILNQQGSSIIISGTTGWTFYTGLAYSGEAHCFTSTVVGNGGNSYGIYDDLSALTDQNGNSANVDNLFMSCKQGCFTGDKVHLPSKMVTIEKSANGGVGYIEKKL